eukprot:g5822.t1
MPRNLVAKGALMEEKETLHEEAGAHHDDDEEESMVYRPAAELESAEGLPAAPWESNANSHDHEHNMMSGHDLQEPPSTAALHTKKEHSDTSRALQSLGIGTGIPAVETDPKVCYICEPTTQLLVPDETAGRRCVKKRRTPGYTITENVYMTTEQTVMKIDTLEQCEALGGNELEDAQRFCRDVNLEAWTRGYDNDILCLAYKRTFSPDCCRPMNQERCEICGSGIDMPYGVMEPTQQNGGVCKAFNQEDFVMSGFTQMHVFPNSWRQQFYVTPAWDFGETSNLKVGFPAGERTFVLENGHYRAKLVTEQSALSPCTHVGGTTTRPYRAVMACLLIHQLYMRVENLVPGGFYRYELFQHLEPNPYTLNVTYFTTMDVQRFSHGDTPVGSSSPGETAGGAQNQLSAAYQMPEPYTFHPAWDAKDRKRDLNAPAQEGYATADGDGVIRFRLYAAGARDTVVLSGLNIKRAANKRGAQNAVLIDRMHSQQRCAVTGGYEVVGDVTCEEVQYHYASNFRKNSEGCAYLRERFTHGYCAPGGVRVKGCCRQGNPPPQFCSPAEQAAAVAAALAAQERAEEQEQTDLVAEIVGVTLIVLFVVGGIVFYCFGRQLLAQVRVFLAQEENRQFFARMTENNAYGTKVAPGGMKKKKNKNKKIEDQVPQQDETGSKQGSKDGDDARDHAKKVMSRSATRDSITSSRGGGVGEKDVDIEAKDADEKSESGRSQSSKHSRRSSSKRTPGGEEDDETGGSSSSGFSDSEFTSENASTLSSEAERKQRHKERKAERIRAQRAERMASLAKAKKSSLAARAAFLTALATVLPVVQARFDVWRDGVLYECDDWVNPWNVDPRFHPGCRRYSSWRRMIGLWVSLIVFFVILAIFFPIYCCVRSNQADVVVIEEQPVSF